MDRYLIEHRSWSPWQLSFVLPVFVFAVLFIVSLDGPQSWAGVLAGWIGLSLTALLGLAVMSRRSGFRIDPAARTFERWHAALFLRQTRRGSMDAFQRVELTLGTVHGSSVVNYAVSLRREEGRRLRLSRFSEPDAARAIAEEIVRETHKPLVDGLGDEEIEQAPETLAGSLRERVLRDGRARPEIPDPPAGMRTRVELLADQVRFEIPPPELIRRLVLPLLGVVALEVALVVAYFGLDRGVDWAVVPGALRGFIVAVHFASPAVAAALLLAAARQGLTIVEADSRRLRVEIHKPLGKQSIEIPSDKLTDLLITRELAARARLRQGSSGRAIVARGRGQSVAFGGHLPEGEKRWIRDVLEQALAA